MKYDKYIVSQLSITDKFVYFEYFGKIKCLKVYIILRFLRQKPH